MLCPKSLAAMLSALALVVPAIADAKPTKPAPAAHAKHEPKKAKKVKRPYVFTGDVKPVHGAEPKKRARLEPIIPRHKAAMKKAESVGFPNEGKLVGGVHLDTALPYVRIVPAYAKNDTRWGLPELVHAIERAAKGVAKKHPDAILNVGDLSRKNGGEIDRHNSHESGRDIDVGFYVTDAKGKAVHAKTFVRFDESMKATNYPGAHFDTGRTWLFLEKLFTDQKAHVTHVFVAEHVKDKLLRHARAKGVSAAVLAKAQTALMQPRKGLPHDDHMHIRVSCPHATKNGEKCFEYSKGAIVGAGNAAIGADGKAHAIKGAKRQAVLHTPKREAAVQAVAHKRKSKRGIVVAKERSAGDAKVVPFVKNLLDKNAPDDGADVRVQTDDEGLAKITD